jgi:hypothetical protein
MHDNASAIAAGQRARSRSGTILERMRQRMQARAATQAGWSTASGGSSPLGGPARSPAEAKLAHRLQSRASYQRNRSSILARRRVRRGTAGMFANLATRLRNTA